MDLDEILLARVRQKILQIPMIKEFAVADNGQDLMIHFEPELLDLWNDLIDEKDALLCLSENLRLDLEEWIVVPYIHKGKVRKFPVHTRMIP